MAVDKLHAGAPKEKLGGCRQMRSHGDGHYLGRSRRTGSRQSRMASTCGPIHPSVCGMNYDLR